MVFLKNLFYIEDLVFAISALAIIFFCICCSIILSRILRNSWTTFRNNQLNQQTMIIFHWLETGDPRALRAIKHSIFVAEKIANLGSEFCGDEREKLALLYTLLGFTKRDFAAMQSFSKKIRSMAFLRCRKLLIPIPQEGWNILLQSRSPIFRWAVMEYLIEIKKDKSLPWVFYFCLQQKIKNKGVILHLFSALAKIYPEALPIILVHADEEHLTEQALRVLAAYPTPSAQEAVIRSLKSTASNETAVAAIKALGFCPDERSLSVYRAFIGSDFWVIRLMIAQGLENFPQTDALSMLEILSQDVSYFVRRSAFASLIQQLPEALPIIDEIKADPDHPCHQIAREMTEAGRLAA